MKRYTIALIVLMSILLNHIVIAKDIFFNDGQTHTLSDGTYQWDRLVLDFDIANEPGTRLVLEEGGAFSQVWAFNRSTVSVSGGLGDVVSVLDDSEITMTGGSLISGIVGEDNGTITLAGGSMWASEIYDNSVLNMSAGTIDDYITAAGYSKVNISGGSIGNSIHSSGNNITTITGGTVGNLLSAQGNGIIYVDGFDFQVNGTPLSFGDRLSDFVPLIEDGENDYYTGTITGILNDDSVLNTTFKIQNTGNNQGMADIIVIPEPATLSLLALGGLLLRRRK